MDKRDDFTFLTGRNTGADDEEIDFTELIGEIDDVERFTTHRGRRDEQDIEDDETDEHGDDDSNGDCEYDI